MNLRLAVPFFMVADMDAVLRRTAIRRQRPVGGRFDRSRRLRIDFQSGTDVPEDTEYNPAIHDNE